MKFNQLEAYRAVMLTGSVTEGANYLHVSQPGVSRLIKDLERAIGFQLFDRRPGRIVPTRDGLSFYKHVQRSFEGIMSLESVAREIATLKHDRLRIASFPAGALAVVPEAVVHMSRIFPDLQMSIEMRDSAKVLDLVSSMQVDIGLAIMPSDYPGVVVERSYWSGCVCALPENHPLARSKELSPADIEHEKLLAVADGLSTGTELRKVFARQGRDFHATVEASSSHSICALVERGLGVGVVDPLSAAVFLNRKVAVRRFLPLLNFNFAIVLPEHLVRSRAVEEFVRVLHSVVKSAVREVEMRVPLSIAA